MAEVNVNERKGSGRAIIAPDDKTLVGHIEAAGMLTISCRALDYLVANKQFLIRRIGTRVLIPVSNCDDSLDLIIRSVQSIETGTIPPQF
jgi:hypothetical protein